MPEWDAPGRTDNRRDYFCFSCPDIAPLMNRLEGEWHQLLTHEIAGRLFEDEYDLATAILNGMEARSVPGCYTLKRFKFNSA